MVNDEPLPNDVPPVEDEYQFITPELAVALIVTEPVPHRLPGVVAVIVGKVEMVARTDVLVVDIQLPSTASAQ